MNRKIILLFCLVISCGMICGQDTVRVDAVSGASRVDATSGASKVNTEVRQKPKYRWVWRGSDDA